MRPCVDTELVALHVLFNKNIGALDDSRPNDEESGLEVLFIQEIKQFPLELRSGSMIKY